MRRAGLFIAVGTFASFLLWAPAVFAQAWVPGPPEPRVDDPGADAADTVHGAWNWDLGALISGLKYSTELEIENACQSNRAVYIFVNDLPELQFDLSGCNNGGLVKQCHKDAPPGSSKVAATISSDFDYTWLIDPNSPVTAPRPYRKVEGTVIVFHPDEADCLQARDVYNTGFMLGGHRITWDPPPPGPEKIIGAGPCQVWWNTATKPSMLEEGEDCTSIIRPLALGFLERILPPYIAKSPNDWKWLPQSGALSEMTSEQMVDMKIRAQLIINRQGA